MNMPVPVGVTPAGGPGLLTAHDAQNARRTRLQHINNSHTGAAATHSQTPCPALPASRCRSMSPSSHGWAGGEFAQECAGDANVQVLGSGTSGRARIGGGLVILEGAFWPASG